MGNTGTASHATASDTYALTAGKIYSWGESNQGQFALAETLKAVTIERVLSKSDLAVVTQGAETWTQTESRTEG